MSRFEFDRDRSSTLIVESAATVEIEILDAAYKIRARGVGSVKIGLPDGIYTVTGQAGGSSVQELVRLPASVDPFVLLMKTPQSQGPAEALSTFDALTTAKSPKNTSRVLPSEEARGSELAVVIRDRKAEGDLRRSLRLIDSAGTPMRSNRQNAASLKVEDGKGIAARSYSIAPGEYRLQYISLLGETMHQTVPALPGRRTIVLMTAGTGTVLRAHGKKFAPVSTTGVDASQTVIVSAALTKPARDYTERVHVAELLLADLAKNAGSLDTTVLAVLDDASCDPLLLTYAATAALQALQAKVAPSPSDLWPSEGGDKDFVRRWTDRAAGWLDRAAKAGVGADVQAATWRLGDSGSKVPTKRATLANPPMLECNWLWAAAYSVRSPKAIPRSVAFRAAVRGSGGTSPWLAWRAASAKGGAARDPIVREMRLDALIEKVSTKLGDIADASPEKPGFDPFSFLSPESRSLAMLARRVSLRASNPLAIESSAAETLAMNMGAPAPVLQNRLSSLLDELLAKSSSRSGSHFDVVERSAITRAPALSRLIRYPDDPHKGRFGKESTRGGFSINADFGELSRNWVQLRLSVRGPGDAIRQAVVFHLHDSFDPDRYVCDFNRGRATLKLTVWGGFTVGVWIPATRIELELDLTKLADAPRIVKER
jgi:hypothetical protein